MMWLEVNDVPYTSFTAMTAEARLDTLANSFSFEAVNVEELPFRGGERCRVMIDDIPVVTGWLEVISGGSDSTGHNIVLQGRDLTADLVDSSIASLSDIRPPITLKGLIERVITHLGTTLSVIDLAVPKPFNVAEDLSAPEPGENAFSFLERHARKRQVLLTFNGDGAVVITQASGIVVPFKLQYTRDSARNNVLNNSFSYDITGRYSQYRLTSAMNPLALLSAGNVGTDEVVNQASTVTDDDIRTGRQLVITSESNASNEQNRLRATWEANIRKTRGRVYSATVQGFFDNDGNLLAPNTVIQVVDDFAGINAPMLINAVTYSLSVSSGSLATLSLVDQRAYSLQLEEPVTEEVGNGLF